MSKPEYVGFEAPSSCRTIVDTTDASNIVGKVNNSFDYILEKPKISYVALITMALKTTLDGRMTVAEIYKYFQDNYSFFRKADKKGWQNSVRHNLSLNDCFVKIPRDGVAGPTSEKKGNYWALAAGFEDMFPDGNFKRRRRMRRPVKVYQDIPNPFELLNHQTYQESLWAAQQTHDAYYQIQPPPYSSIQYNFNNQLVLNSSNFPYATAPANVQMTGQLMGFCVPGVTNRPGSPPTKVDGGGGSAFTYTSTYHVQPEQL